MYVNFLSTYYDKKSCHTSTTLQTSMHGLSAIAELLVLYGAQTELQYSKCDLTNVSQKHSSS